MAELLTAVDRGDASALQPLLESRADPEACGSDGRSALVCACLANNLPVAKLLITYQAAVDTAIADGETALRAACVEGSADCVQLLLERGANVHARGEHGSALQVASSEEVRDLLVQHQAVLP